ncbi:hypothetical protein [Dermatobacter hominis]|uniref:hypothetical protein n=1 Tax=Dermatobacter hominis TaxID=2884263 RepID=UPI001D0F5834|nr:hypothetical protein [Dermatobacter hominis]UDY36293.1 hypothetical protein LH044_01870 [Dermatobacter hominis]
MDLLPTWDFVGVVADDGAWIFVVSLLLACSYLASLGWLVWAALNGGWNRWCYAAAASAVLRLEFANGMFVPLPQLFVACALWSRWRHQRHAPAARVPEPAEAG